MDTPNGSKIVLELQLRAYQTDPEGRRYGSGTGLEIIDRMELAPMGFLEVAAVLGRFHELAETIERERK